MRRQLSSYLTFFLRIILPVFLILCWVGMTIALIVSPAKDNQMTLPGILSISAMWFVVFAPILYFGAFRYVVVSVDDRFLYASNYLKEIMIPLSNIRDVTEFRVRGRPITVHLKIPSEFGLKINFLPKMAGVGFFKPHPFVDELKRLAAGDR